MLHSPFHCAHVCFSFIFWFEVTDVGVSHQHVNAPEDIWIFQINMNYHVTINYDKNKARQDVHRDGLTISSKSQISAS